MGSSHSKEKKVLFLGLDNAGKTSIINALHDVSVYCVAPTRGFNIRPTQIDNVNFQVWDIGGQRSFRSRWENFFDNVQGLVWVIDSSDNKRMFETGLELSALLSNQKLLRLPVLILANKSDLVTSLSPEDITIELELHGIRDRIWKIQGCSAITKEGLEEGLKWMSSVI